MKSISIVLPTYNEKKNISILIPKLEAIFKNKFKKMEIIVVDDSSPDGTAKEAQKLNKKYKNIRTIIRKKKQGIGAALRHGYNSAKNEVIVSSDSDLSFDPKDILRLVEKIENGYDLVVGCRHSDDKKSFYEKKKILTSIKYLISRWGNKIITSIAGIKIHDFSANFRAIKKEVWRSIKTQEKTNSILLEMIMKAHYKGFKVGEIPVTFKDRVYGDSKLNLLKEAPKFFFKLIKFTFNIRILKRI